LYFYKEGVDMKSFIKEQIKGIAISGIRQFDMKAAYVDDVIKLTLGEVDFDTFDHIKQAVSNAALENKTRYTPNAGIEELRKQISYRYEHYTMDNIIVTVGTTEGLSTIIKSVIGPGDEVIIPTPGYVGYKPLVTIEQGIVREVDISRTNFILTKEALEDAYTTNTKAMLLSNPNNPTGKIYSLDEMAIVKDFVLTHDILLIADEVYSEIDFYGKFQSFSVYPELMENLLILDGFSKSHAMAGFRIGYIVGEGLMIKELLKTHQYSVTSATSLSQYAALAAREEDSKEIVAQLLIRKDYITSRLQERQIRYIEPDGAFYLFVDISPYMKSSIAFCERLLFRYKVAAIPGESFLGEPSNYIRLSYAVDMNLLQQAMDRLFAFVDEFEKKR
jgi:aminotransferase